MSTLIIRDLDEDRRVVLEQFGPDEAMVADPQIVTITAEDVRRAREQWFRDAPAHAQG
ncbi:MAG TPA: hypothetical protein VFM14_02090 [Gemmatimonadales bacterium]|nr:hypothetical protein [Gemmatimonadales bacterium]